MQVGKNNSTLERISFKLVEFIGTPMSIIIHSFFFIGVFILIYFGFSFYQTLLFLTTILSIEAIYLSLFIQMSVNKTSKSLKEIEKDVDDLDEDVEEITDDIKEDDIKDLEIQKILQNIEARIHNLQNDINSLKLKGALGKK